jgi:hypothetical protein
MKIKRDNQGVISVQINPRERYCILFHRLNKGKYEQYIKRHNETYLLSADELKQVHKYIQGLEVKDDRGTKKSNRKV